MLCKCINGIDLVTSIPVCLCWCRMESCWEQTRELPPVKWWLTRCVQRSTTLLRIYSKSHSCHAKTKSGKVHRGMLSLLWVYDAQCTSIFGGVHCIFHLNTFCLYLRCPTFPSLTYQFTCSSFPSTFLSFYSSLSLPSCCGAGTAADTEKTTDLLSSNLTIFSLNSGRNPRVIMAVNILQDMLYRFVEHQTCTCMSCTTAPTFKICWSDLMTQYTLKR